ncbi:hypothetical protein WMF04_48640 [Sorangium sp. So ce260]|uniref:hypothetical protein n=1 Tax=Sorangium sp. So ce260 TaxID=3133291 RepID=UPI003F5DC183
MKQPNATERDRTRPNAAERDRRQPSAVEALLSDLQCVRLSQSSYAITRSLQMCNPSAPAADALIFGVK